MISMNGFLREPEGLRKQELAAVERVLRSGWYILGDEVKSFEAEWARAIGTEHAVGVGNGLDAIEIALRAMGVGTGDEVITTPMTAFASVLAVIRAGAQPVLADIDSATALMSIESGLGPIQRRTLSTLSQPVLADIDSATALMSIESVRRCMGPRTRAVLLVHLYGQVNELGLWREFCSDAGIHLIEDCAQAHLAEWDGGRAGAVGEVGAFSFYPTKNLG